MTLRLDEPFRWGGAVTPPSIPIPHDGMATVAKAATGLERSFNGDKPMLSSISRSPRKIMREAQALYYTHPWIRSAEKTVTAKVAGLPWHVEDDNDDEVDDETVSPALQAVRDLLEKPQAALPMDQRQPGIGTRRGLTSITSRHMGLCGIAYWYLDQMDIDGLPLALLYLNPARMTVDATKAGNLMGYRLDADDYGRGGTPLAPESVLAFYLEEPDWGSEVMGLPLAAALKTRIVTAADVHTLSVLGTGGRIAGLVSPKDGYIDDPDRYAQLERDFRNVNEAPDAAKRMTILRGPIDFNKTAADPQELGLLNLGHAGRDDIFAIWGVPASQAGVGGQTVGLNSGETRRYEQQILMQGPVHDRVVAIRETIQFGLLDRYVEITPELVIEEPSYDDNSVPYEIAAKAKEQPLTNNERRAILEMDPLPDYGPDGEPLGVAIVLPSTMTTWAQGAEDKSSPDNPFPNAPKPKPLPMTPVPLPQLGAGSPPPVPAVGKAAGFLGLRHAVDTRVVPAIRQSLVKFLASQRSDIAERIRGATSRQLKDETYWWGNWDKALTKVLRPHVAGIAQTVTQRTAEILTTGKAKKAPPKIVAAVEAVDLDPFVAKVERYVLEQTGTRIAGINATTREAVGAVIRAGIDESLTAQQIAERIEQMPAFDEARAELVARTESMFAYNSAALTSYGEFGVDQVEAIDGDGDPECAARHGEVMSLDAASAIEDHPNGTLDWVPVFAPAKAEPITIVLAQPEPRQEPGIRILRDVNGKIERIVPDLGSTIIERDADGEYLGVRYADAG